jgi:hypothetical protein
MITALTLALLGASPLTVLTVRDAEGQPLEGAEIEVLGSSAPRIKTDVEGHARFERPRADTQVLVVAPAPLLNQVVTARAGTDALEVRLLRGGVVNGRVRWANGRPGKGLNVRIANVDGLTGPDGRFQLEGLTPGQHTSQCSTAPYRHNAVDCFAQVEVSLDKPAGLELEVYATDANLSLTRSPPDAEGRRELAVEVQRPNGKRVALQSLFLSRPFQFPVPSGKLVLIARANDEGEPPREIWRRELQVKPGSVTSVQVPTGP